MALTPTERTLRAQIAAHAMHAKHPVQETTRAGHTAFLKSFELRVDPTGELEPQERQRRAEHARKAHMLRLSLKAAKARRNKAATS